MKKLGRLDRLEADGGYSVQTFCPPFVFCTITDMSLYPYSTKKQKKKQKSLWL